MSEPGASSFKPAPAGRQTPAFITLPESLWPKLPSEVIAQVQSNEPLILTLGQLSAMLASGGNLVPATLARCRELPSIRTYAVNLGLCRPGQFTDATVTAIVDQLCVDREIDQRSAFALMLDEVAAFLESKCTAQPSSELQKAAQKPAGSANQECMLAESAAPMDKTAEEQGQPSAPLFTNALDRVVVVEDTSDEDQLLLWMEKILPADQWQSLSARKFCLTSERRPTGDGVKAHCFFCGHGAYDPRLAQPGDASNGHFLALPGGDLPRITLFEKLRSKNARLTVLVSDACNVQGLAQVRPSKVYTSVSEGKNWVLANLLLDHVGLIDVNGSSRNQFAWSSSDIGGWFSSAFLQGCDPEGHRGTQFVTWDSFLRRVSDATSQLFQDRKKTFLADPQMTPADVLDLLRQQPDQRPEIFVKKVRKADGSRRGREGRDVYNAAVPLGEHDAQLVLR